MVDASEVVDLEDYMNSAIPIQEDSLTADGGFEIAFNVGGVPSYTLRSQIGTYWFVHEVVKTSNDERIAFETWEVSVLDSCSSSLIEVCDGYIVPSKPTDYDITREEYSASALDIDVL